MGRRYFCEYCERAFQDNKSARKKHLQSNLHQQHKKAWYNQFKDKRQKLEEELAKPKLCIHYDKNGFCSFGENCRYRHLRDDEIAAIKNNLESSKSSSEFEERTVERWMLERNIKSECTKGDETEASNDNPFISEPKVKTKVTSQDLTNLPPSLQPPPESGWSEIEDVSWG